jgi:hypothetical protein
LKSVSNEGHFTFEAERVSRRYLPKHWNRMTEIRQIALPANALRAMQGRMKSVSNEGHFPIEDEISFRLYLPSHCSQVTEICHMALRMRYEQCKLGLKSVCNEGHLTLEAETVSRRFTPRIALG